jgi:hypothetical protein
VRPSPRSWLLTAALAVVGCTSVLGINESYRFDATAVGGGGGSSTTTTGSQSGGGPSSSSGAGANDPLGANCNAADDCMSHHCADGVCCDDACDGLCAACDAAGHCGFLAKLTDPDSECQGAQTCDGMGNCFSCGVEPPPPGQAMCPTECTGGCTVDNECLIACTSAVCMGQPVTCPMDYACRVTCNETDACLGATITCPDSYACNVECNGNSACRDAVLTCSTGVCAMDCAGGGQVCNNTNIQCGSEMCSASCPPSSKPTLSCGQACDCGPC